MCRTATHGEVVLRGELDTYTVPELDRALSDVVGEGRPRRIVVDLRGLEFIDVTGVGALVSANNGAHRAGSELVLRGPNKQARKLLEITGLDQVFTIEGC